VWYSRDAYTTVKGVLAMLYNKTIPLERLGNDPP